MAKTITVSHSEIDSMRQCLHKHELGYKERWQAPTTSRPLSRGILWHQVLETHYRIIWEMQKGNLLLSALPEVLKRQVVGKLLYNDDLSQTEDQELIEWMYTGHVEQYGFDEDWRIMAVEFAPEVYLPTDRGGRSRFKLKLKIDLVVRDRTTGDKLWIVDHKSGKDLPKKKELDIGDQFGLYTWAMRQIGHRVFGSVHSAARTQRNKDQEKHPQTLDSRFHRTLLSKTEIELNTIAIEAYRTARAAYRWKPGEAPRSPDEDRCRWRCDYTEVCLMGRKGMNEHEMLESSGYVQDFTRH